MPDAAQQAIKNEHHEDQTYGESQIIQRADPVPAVYHQLLDSGGNGKGDQQQNHGNHIGGKEWPYIVEKTAEPENGHQQASDHHRGVDGFDPKALTGNDPHEKHRRRTRDQRQPVSPEELAEKGRSADKQDFLQVENLTRRIGEVKGPDHFAQNNDGGNEYSRPLEPQKKGLHKGWSILEPVFEFHFLFFRPLCPINTSRKRQGGKRDKQRKIIRNTAIMSAMRVFSKPRFENYPPLLCWAPISLVQCFKPNPFH